MAANRDRASDKPPKRRPRKPQPSFEAPAVSAAPGWVYRSGADAIVPPVVAEPRERDGCFERRADVVTMPLTLLITTILAPVGWLFGRSGRR